MGTTYSNIQVRIGSQDAVVSALTPLLEEPAYVSPSVNGWVGVYPEGGGGVVEALLNPGMEFQGFWSATV